MSGLPSSSSSSSSATDTQTALQAAAALHAGGRPSDPIWNHFNRQPVPGKKYYEADCKYCQKIFKVGKPTELKFHIIDCRLAPEDVLVMVRALLPQDDEGNIIKPAWHKRTSGNAFGEEDGPPTRSPYSRSATAQRLSMVERGLVPGPVRSGSVVASQDGLDTDGEGGGGAPQAAPAPRVVRDNIAVPRFSGIYDSPSRPTKSSANKNPTHTSNSFLTEGAYFMDFELPDHTHTLVRLSELNGPTVMDRRIGFDQGNDFGYPLILIFIRGFFCPKDQEQLRQIVKSWEELKVSYAKVAVVSVDPPLVNGAFRAGLGAEFTFFSDEGGMITRRLGLLDNTEGEYPGRSRPYTLVLDGKLKIKKSYDGWWFAGRPTIEELRKEIRNILSRRTSYRFDAWTKPEVTSVRIPADVWAHGLIPIPSRGGSEATGTVRWFDPALGQGAIVVANNYWTRGRGTISWMDFMGNINNDSNLLEGGEGGNSGNAAAAGTNANGATVVPGAPSIDDEVFFHFTAIPGVGSRSAKPGQKVRFELLRHKNCWIGFNVQPLPDDGA